MPTVKIFNVLFPEGKRKALTLSYDDGVKQDFKLVEILNKYHIKSTFNLGSGLFGVPGTLEMNDKKVDVSRIQPADVNNLYKGHEVAGHAYTHMALNTADTAAAMYEVITERKVLEDITGGLVRGFAYPFGVFDNDTKTVLKLAGVAYARTVESVKNFKLPTDSLEWNPTCHHSDPELMQLAQKFCNEPQFFYQPQLFYLWGHAYEFDQFDNWHVIEEFAAYMAQYQNDIWIATNIEIIDYLNAYKQLKFSADGNMIYNPTSLKIWFALKSDTYVVCPGETIKLKEGGKIL